MSEKSAAQLRGWIIQQIHKAEIGSAAYHFQQLSLHTGIVLPEPLPGVCVILEVGDGNQMTDILLDSSKITAFATFVLVLQINKEILVNIFLTIVLFLTVCLGKDRFLSL